jgi:hypothetical protein
MSHAELLKQLIDSIEASDISQGHREQIMRPVEDAAMEEVLAIPSMRGWEDVLRGYVDLGVIDVMERFYRTESSREARVIWRVYGGTEDHQVEDYIALWDDRNETIPQWKEDILRR